MICLFQLLQVRVLWPFPPQFPQILRLIRRFFIAARSGNSTGQVLVLCPSEPHSPQMRFFLRRRLLGFILKG